MATFKAIIATFALLVVPKLALAQPIGPGTPLTAGADGCLAWTEEVLDGGTTPMVTTDPDTGVPIPVEVAPGGACFSYTLNRVPLYLIPEPTIGELPNPGCDPGDVADCPSPGATDVPTSVPGGTRPANPYGYTMPPRPGAGCFSGSGYSFEDGVFAPWSGTGVFANGPVYGNNVSIDRIRPPGYTTSTDGPRAAIGGDYWEFSRDIHQAGDYWVGSRDVRQAWWMAPGTTVSEMLTGTLTSPQFIVASRYVSFRIGGTRNSSQRVELWVRSENAADAASLAATYAGIGGLETPPGPAIPAFTMSNWVLVRASASLGGESMRRTVVWNLQRYLGRGARLRVVDEPIPPGRIFVGGVAIEFPAHVNVDAFECNNIPPRGAQGLWDAVLRTRSDAIAELIAPERLWGTSDAHSHAVANVTFGGHYIWGDVGDPLSTVYNCERPLPSTDEAGNVIRAPIPNPGFEEHCYVQSQIIALIMGVGAGACATASSAAMAADPLFGPLLGAIIGGTCNAALVTFAGGLAALPLVSARTYHGARTALAGGFSTGIFLDPFFGGSVSQQGILEELDWDLPNGRHSGHSLGRSHNRYHATMIRRAWQGGLRLMVIDALNNRAMQEALDGRDDYDDWQAIADSVAAVRRLTAPAGTPRPGPLRDIAEIALTPARARAIIASNRIAIVLGTEVPELGKARFPGDTPERQVADLFALGIRKITPIHGMNNPLGGTGFFNDIYNSGNFYLNVTRNANSDLDGTWVPNPINFLLPPSLPFPAGGLDLGPTEFVSQLLPNSCVGLAVCPYNLRNRGWFEVQSSYDRDDDFIGDQERISFFVGAQTKGHLKERARGVREERPDLYTSGKIGSLDWLLGAAPLGGPPSQLCSMENMYMPLPALNIAEMPPDDPAWRNWDDHIGHMNVLGLSNDGRRFLDAMMSLGMIIDTDHLGQLSRLDAHQQVREFRDAIVPPSPLMEYPVFGVHSDVRGVVRSGPVPDDLRNAFGFESEVSKTPNEIDRIRRAGGVISPGVNGNLTEDEYDLVTEVFNDCDFSSKSYAVKYLTMMHYMRGVGLTPSLDMNSPAPVIVSRYGRGRACFADDKPNRWDEDLAYDLKDLASWPRDWHEDLDDEDCRYNANRAPGTWDDDCLSTFNVKAQLKEFSGVEYTDYAARPHWTEAEITWKTEPRPELQVVTARTADENRDDNAPRSLVNEHVAIGGGRALRQMRPMRKFITTAGGAPLNTGWDINLDGVAHIGMLPDFFQDLRNVGLPWEQLGPLFNAGEDFIAMWERACSLARDSRNTRGLPPVVAMCEE